MTLVLHPTLDESLANTLDYFAVNYTILAAGLGIATLSHRRRHGADTSPVEVTATAI